MELYNKFLQSSVVLYNQLEKFPDGDERESYIEEITAKLEQRDQLAIELKQSGFKYDEENGDHITLFEIDKGIRERLNNLLNIIKADMKDLQNAKKNEVQYANPYGHVQSMDGMYYDKKK